MDKDKAKHLKEYEEYEKRLKIAIPSQTDMKEKSWLEARLSAVERCIFAISK